MKKLLLLLFPIISFAQTGTVLTSTVNTETWGKPANVMVSLPIDYKTKTYPVFWFWNGLGEDQGGVSALKVWGPFSFIGANWQPNFTTIAVQGMEWLDQAHTDSVYTKLKATYNLGPVVASGLSAGGYGVTKLMSYYPGSIFSRAVVAIIPMSTSEGFGSTAVIPVIASGITVWAFGDEINDVHGVNTYNFYKALVAANKTGNYRWTSMYPRGHGGWNDFYTPNYKESGLSIYDWGMQFARLIPPLALTYINLEYMDGLLTWTVDDTNDIDHFEIQTSDDGKNFHTVSITDAYAYSVQ